jgi:signal transduction histidine kinase
MAGELDALQPDERRGASDLHLDERVLVAEAVSDALATLGEGIAGDIEVTVDPAVAVTVEPDGDTVTIEVSDAGDGVPPAFERHLFRAFAQASVGDRRTASGLGLGLSIVEGLVVENQGRVHYRRSDGRTRFRVDLPAARDARVSAG